MGIFFTNYGFQFNYPISVVGNPSSTHLSSIIFSFVLLDGVTIFNKLFILRDVDGLLPSFTISSVTGSPAK